MHLANGTVTPMCAVYGAAVAATGLGIGFLAARRAGAPQPWRLAIATALVFVAQSLNLSVLPGVSGHLIGGFLLAYWFGAGWGLFSITSVLLVQALFMGDGALSTLGLNIVNMGVIPCLIVHAWFKHVRRDGNETAAIAVAAWLSAVLAAGVCGFELQRGTAAIASMLTLHAAIGVIEATLTVAIILAARRLATFKLVPAAIVSSGAVAAVLLLAIFASSTAPDGLNRTLAQTTSVQSVER